MSAPVSLSSALTYADRRALYLSVPCPMPRCGKPAGWPCTTPNGWAAGTHKARIRLATGEEPKAAKPRKHRLTDAQAQRIEIAAEYGQFYAAGQYANLGGDAAERAVADALERHGLVEQVSADKCGERTMRLTDDGWRTYWHHRLVIRRLPEERHDEACPCAEERAGSGDQVLCRTASDEWVPMVAMSGPRYDHEHASGRTVWMSVAVALVADWEIAEADAAWANWPAQDVRLEDGAR